MTKKNYILIAETLNGVLRAHGEILSRDQKLVFDNIVARLALELALDNPKFDEAMFNHAVYADQ